MNKPKRTQPETPKELQERDFFQTPNYATDLIIPYLPAGVIWECASGNGKIANRLARDVIQTDIQSGFNFLADKQESRFDLIVTNPPFSLKRKFFEKCLSYNVPFALLLPVDFCGWILRAMMDDRSQWLIPTRRIDYITPTGRQGADSTAQYHSGWFCYGLNLPKQITIVELTNEMKENV
jgi:hypothetical protein